MKKIKGGKREGAGRKKTGRKTEVVSFSVPKELVKEIKEMVKQRLATNVVSATVNGIPLPADYVDMSKGVISAISLDGVVVIPDLAAQVKKDTINKRIAELRSELKNPPKNPLIGMKRWLLVRETELKSLEQKLNA